jgi:hypothetical protein
VRLQIAGCYEERTFSCSSPLCFLTDL